MRDCDPLTGEPRQRVVRGLGIRYERSRPGELLHMDVKKLAAIPPGGGWPVHGRGNVAKLGVGWTLARLRRRRLHPTGLLRGASRRESPHRRRIHHPGVAVLPGIRHHPHPRNNDRQPPGLHPQPPVQSPPHASGDQAPHHQTPKPPTKRQSGTLPPNPQTQMGQPASPAQRRNQNPGPPQLAPPQPPTPHQPRGKPPTARLATT